MAIEIVDLSIPNGDFYIAFCMFTRGYKSTFFADGHLARVAELDDGIAAVERGADGSVARHQGTGEMELFPCRKSSIMANNG